MWLFWQGSRVTEKRGGKNGSQVRRKVTGGGIKGTQAKERAGRKRVGDGEEKTRDSLTGMSNIASKCMGLGSIELSPEL